MYTFLSRISSIILHVSFLPNFRKCHSSIHFFLEGMISLYFSIVSSTSNLGKANGGSFEKKTKKKPIGSGYWNLFFLTLSYWNLYFLFSFLFEISNWNLYFLFILLYWNLLFLTTCLWKPLVSEHCSIEISTLWELSYWNLYFLFTFLLKSLLPEYFPIEISTSLYFSIEISFF